MKSTDASKDGNSPVSRMRLSWRAALAHAPATDSIHTMPGHQPFLRSNRILSGILTMPPAGAGKLQ